MLQGSMHICCSSARYPSTTRPRNSRWHAHSAQNLLALTDLGNARSGYPRMHLLRDALVRGLAASGLAIWWGSRYHRVTVSYARVLRKSGGMR